MKNTRKIKKIKYKVVERQKVPKNKYGRIEKKNHSLEPHEENTIDCLATYGFDIEAIAPSNIPHSKNPDILMLGTFWEMKGPQTTDEETIATHFRKAVKQANGKAIFDLRYVVGDTAEVENIVMKLFATTRGMKRIMILKTDGDDEKLLDILK